VPDTTYSFAASIVRAKVSIHSGLAPVGAGYRIHASIISYVTRPAAKPVPVDFPTLFPPSSATCKKSTTKSTARSATVSNRRQPPVDHASIVTQTRSANPNGLMASSSLPTHRLAAKMPPPHITYPAAKKSLNCKSALFFRISVGSQP
jgi:hypothetical protein